jgi:hypothetical protein
MVFTISSMLLRLLGPIFLLAPPAPLACLQRYYGVALEQDAHGWWVRAGDARIPWDDGIAGKSAEARLEHPDVEDAFAQPYAVGPTAQVTTPDLDPGRVRLDGVLRAAYPRRELVRVDFLGHRVWFHARAAPALARVAARLRRALAADASLAAFVTRLGGTVVERTIAGTDRPSAHSWGIAIDLDPARADYWRWQKGGWRHRMPQAIVDAFEAEGFIWGGRWFHYDTMHFEYRPELLDRACFLPSP